MPAVDNTSIVLYRYLRALSVKVSRCTVSRLLDTPVGNSMRGISDALDALYIRNEVYQLPPSADYFVQVEVPFITMLQVDKNPFCVVTKKDDFIVEFSNSEGKNHCMEVDAFLKKWTGNILIGEITQNTPSNSFHFWNDIYHHLLKKKILITIILVITISFLNVLQRDYYSFFMIYLGTLSLGIFTSIAILYKEQFNELFLEQFCHIGKVVDCNKVLHSKGAKIAEISLGEASLLYFSVMFLFSIIRQNHFYGISAICCIIAVCFTVYSIIYQSFILGKGCMLCMLINLIIWSNALELYLLKDEFVIDNTLLSLFTFIVIGSICLAVGITFKQYIKEYKERYTLKEQLSMLFQPKVFQNLLELEPHIKENIPFIDFAINNLRLGDNRLLIITNPTCKNCAKVHSYIKELSTHVPISLIFIFNENIGKQITEIVLAAYFQEGWNKAILLLDEWFEKHEIKEAKKYRITAEIEEIEKRQLMYCWKQNINQTPTVIINGHYLPEIYTLTNLRYVFT